MVLVHHLRLGCLFFWFGYRVKYCTVILRHSAAAVNKFGLQPSYRGYLHGK